METRARSMPGEMDAIIKAVRTCPVRSGTESDLHKGLIQGLMSAGLTFKVEHRLTALDRLDLAAVVRDHELRESLVAIEVKIKGGVSALDRQVARYASHPDVAAVVIVSSKVQHAQVARVANGKPVFVVIRAEGAFR